MSTDTLLSIDNLTVKFGGLMAIKDLSFQVQKGQIHALIGPNGAGKSTTFNCVSRYYNPTSGRVSFDGNDITHRQAHDIAGLGIARTFQNLELFNELSVMDNVLLGTYTHGARGMLKKLQRPDGETQDFAESLLERVGLLDYRHYRANGLDFGRQKMLELARALAIRPTLLLLDEPAAGLRNREIDNLDRILTDLVANNGVTVLLVEHVMQLVMAISQRITVMSFGEKIAEGTPSEIRCNERVIEAYLGKGEGND